MDRNTVAEMVKRLCANGLPQRTCAQNDQRAYQLYLTSAGTDLLDRVLPRDFEVERKLLEAPAGRVSAAVSKMPEADGGA